MDYYNLLEEAKKARLMSYAPYSNFKVGAALLDKDGRVYHGCNIENASYTPTNCAERTAFFKALSEGARDFQAIAIVGAMRGEEADALCAPCGVCRQVMMEFCIPEEFDIILADGKGGIFVSKLRDMLPYGFGPEDLGRKIGVDE